MWGRDKGGLFSFLGKRIALLTPPKRKGFDWQSRACTSFLPPECNACARQSRVSIARRFASASTIRCRSAHLVEVQTNFRLPRHSSMRRAPAMPHSAGSLPPFYRHSRLTIVRRGCWMCRIAGIHGKAMYTAPDCAARAALQDKNCQCAGSRGKTPCLSLGVPKGVFSLEREYPLCPASPRQWDRTPRPLGIQKENTAFAV